MLDVTGNHTTRKFYVYYQPKSEVPAAVDVERNHADAFVEQYPETALLFFDPATQSFQELDPEEFHPDGLYSLVNKYGNVVAVMNVYTVEPEKNQIALKNRKNKIRNDTTKMIKTLKKIKVQAKIKKKKNTGAGFW